MRIFKTLGLVFCLYVIAVVSELIVASNSTNYQGGVSVIVILIILALTAPKVGYRWFDCFFAAIPFYGIFFIFRIANRFAYLPNIDWKERTNSK